MPDRTGSNPQQKDTRGAFEYFKNKMSFTTGPVELNAACEKGSDIVVVDVREKSDYDKAHIPGAISLPKEDWPSLQGLRRDTTNVIYCYSAVCHLGARACVYFSSKNYFVMEMDGGFKAWEENKLPVEGVNHQQAA